MDFFIKTEKDILLSADQIIVGFSGGADSTLLLHKTFNFLTESNYDNKLLALHINHQAQSESHAWEEHCQKFCQDRKIHLQTEKVEITIKGEGFEAAARSARLAVFNSFDKSQIERSLPKYIISSSTNNESVDKAGSLNTSVTSIEQLSIDIFPTVGSK